MRTAALSALTGLTHACRLVAGCSLPWATDALQACGHMQHLQAQADFYQ